MVSSNCLGPGQITMVFPTSSLLTPSAFEMVPTSRTSEKYGDGNQGRGGMLARPAGTSARPPRHLTPTYILQ